MSRAGEAWDFEGNPLPQSKGQTSFPGSLPWHYNERTIFASITKSFEDLLGSKGKQLDSNLKKLGPSKRSSMNGQVAKDLSYEDWLRTQSKTTQIDKLGPARWKLWQDDQLTFPDLVSQQGRGLTVDELRAKAGLQAAEGRAPDGV